MRLSPKVARRGSVLAIGFKLDEAARVAGEVARVAGEVALRTRGVRTKGGRCLSARERGVGQAARAAPEPARC